MKVIKITIDEGLLRELDATEEVQRKGRSAAVRCAVVEYLDRRRRDAIARRYREAYAEPGGLGDEFNGWEDQGPWSK